MDTLGNSMNSLQLSPNVEALGSEMAQMQLGCKHIPILYRQEVPKEPEPNCTYTNLDYNGPSLCRYRITLDGRVHDTGVVPKWGTQEIGGNYGIVMYWGPFNKKNMRILVEIVTTADKTMLLVDQIRGYELSHNWTEVACLVMDPPGGRMELDVGCTVEIWYE